MRAILAQRSWLLRLLRVPVGNPEYYDAQRIHSTMPAEVDVRPEEVRHCKLDTERHPVTATVGISFDLFPGAVHVARAVNAVLTVLTARLAARLLPKMSIVLSPSLAVLTAWALYITTTIISRLLGPRSYHYNYIPEALDALLVHQTSDHLNEPMIFRQAIQSANLESSIRVAHTESTIALARIMSVFLKAQATPARLSCL